MTSDDTSDGRPIDLYARLGLGGPQDRAGLMRALDCAETDAAARRLAAFILCDEVRRAEHDAWWRTLSTVSMLRAHLGLADSVLWSRAPQGDFARVAPTPERIRHAMAEKAPPAKPGAREA